MNAGISKQYMIDTTDQRDGGKHIVSLSVIDDHSGVRTLPTLRIATFEPGAKVAAEEFVLYMNRLASGSLKPLYQEPKPGCGKEP